jgi:hypothetical protein
MTVFYSYSLLINLTAKVYFYKFNIDRYGVSNLSSGWQIKLKNVDKYGE